MNVLIVDGDQRIRETMADILGEMNYFVRTVCDGKQALEMLRTFKVDFIFIDMRIPGLDGIETGKKIKIIQSDAKIIIITANISGKVYENAKRARIQESLDKPIDFKLLEKIISPKEGELIVENGNFDLI